MSDFSRQRFINSVGTLAAGAAILTPRPALAAQQWSLFGFNSSYMNSTTGLMYFYISPGPGKAPVGPIPYLSMVVRPDSFLCQVNRSAWASFPGSWNASLKLSNQIINTNYRYLVSGGNGEIYCSVVGAYVPGTTLWIYSSINQSDQISICYCPTIQMYAFIDIHGKILSWITGAGTSTAVRTGRTITIAGKSYPELSTIDRSWKVNEFAKFRPLVGGGGAITPCVAATLDLVVAGLAIAGVAAAFVATAPALGIAAAGLALLPELGAGLLFGSAVWGLLSAFRAQADACQKANPRDPVDDPNNPSPVITYGNFFSAISWGDDSSNAPPDDNRNIGYRQAL